MRTSLTAARDERDQGFTLIELLVVVIIIGILAAIAIPVFLNQRKKGVDASIKSDLKNAATQVETWATDYPSTPIPPETVVAPAAGSTTVSATSGALNGFKPSPGNTIKLKAGASTGLYTICGFNSGATSATDGLTAAKSMMYDSNAGGLLATASAAC